MLTQRKHKGQATVEYLVLLAVAIIIALVIFAFMGWVPGLAGSLKERQAKLYWASTFPIQIRDYKVTNSTSGTTIMLQNVGDSKVEIKSISMGNMSDTSLSPSGTAARLSSGQSIVFAADGISCTPPGSTYELENVTIVYDSIGGIGNQSLSGDRSLVGRCLTS